MLFCCFKEGLEKKSRLISVIKNMKGVLLLHEQKRVVMLLHEQRSTIRDRAGGRA